MPAIGTIAIWLVGLFALCVMYSLWLESLKKAYEPNWTWATVAGGNLLICGALAGIELSGVPITAGLVLLANGVGGAPVVAWQLWQWSARVRRAREIAHGPAPEGRPRGARPDGSGS